MLHVEGLCAGYGGNIVLNDVTLDVQPGELVTVIGPNGAGKTTLLRAISGLVKVQRGQITFDGESLPQTTPDRIVRRGIIHVPEGRMVLSRMSVRDNLMLGAYACRDGRNPAEFERVIGLFPRLGERLDQLAGTLSGGEQQMLAIGRGLMGQPRLLMLDEPSLGIAPIIVDRLFAVLAEIRARGITILLVEQNATRALAAADRGYVLDFGRISAAGPASALLSDNRIRRIYLGL